MVRMVLKRQFSLLLSFIIAFTMLIPSFMLDVDIAEAATLATDIEGLTASYDEGTWTSSGSILNGSATGTAKTQCDSATSQTSTLTLRNTSGSSALIVFDYQKPVLGSGGSVKIDGDTVTAAGSFSKELANNGEVTVVIFSGNAGAITSSIELDNVKVVVRKDVTTTFIPSENGTYTVNGEEITSSSSLTVTSTEPYELNAVPGTGYKLMGWYGSVDGYFSASTSLTTYLTHDQEVYAVFVEKDAPVFDAGGRWFTDLNEAHSYAVRNDLDKIVLVGDGILPSGSYTIQSGKTLVIPYENTGKINTNKPDANISQAASTPSVFRKLTLSDGAELTVNGALCVNGRINSYNNAYTGATSGKFGYLYLNGGSSVTLNSGASLYCWGYIAGSGTIDAKSGSKVYEPFEIADIRGGTATTGMNNNSQKVMPFSQYYVQNIESPLTLEYGASEVAAGSVTVSGETVAPTIDYLGSMFRLTSGGKFRKTYDPKEDRVTYEITGDASLNSVSISAGISIDTSKYVMPIMENTTIIIHSGTTTINQDLCMIPGSEVIVDSGATVKLASGKNVYVYDRDEWIGNKFIYSSADLKNSYYQPDRASADKFGTDDMKDAMMDINGTADVAGRLYTTSGGADITSSGKTGNILFTTAPAASGTTYQAVQTGTDIAYTSIAVSSPKLHNGASDPGYTETSGSAAGQKYSYCALHDMWEAGEPHEASYELSQWIWEDDMSSARAVFVNTADPDDTKEIEAVISEWRVPATCEEDGSVTYTAAALFNGETYTDIKTEVIPMTGHDWEDPTYIWSKSYKTCTARRVCKNDPEHVEEETADSTEEITKKPSCEEPGIVVYTAVFRNEAFEKQEVKDEVSPTGHDWDDPTYEWTRNYSKCTARRVCKNDPEHVEEETADSTEEITRKPTCTEYGVTTYTVVFKNPAFETQTKERENIEPLGHDWGKVTYVWSKSYRTCTATRVCNNDPEHVQTETVDSTEEITKKPTCEEPGVVTYTAVFRSEAFEKQEVKDEVSPLGHDFDEPTYEWARNYSKCTARRVCKNDPEHIEEETCDSTEEITKKPTCTENGVTTFTVVFKNPAFETQTKEWDNIQPTGHKWGEPAYIWSKSYKTCIARRVCLNDPDHVEEETAYSIEEISVKPTCTEPGKVTYTAVFKNEAFEKQVHDEDLSPLGHKWEDPTYVWSKSYKTCTAKRVCGNDPLHVEEETVNSTSEVTKEPTCEEPGETTFTAVFRSEAFETQTEIQKDIAPLGHTYGEGVITKEPTAYEEGVMTYTCTVCGHEKTEVIPKTDGMGEDGTPLGPGASFEEADKAITGMKSDNDPPGSVFAPLTLRSTRQTAKSVKLVWKSQKKAVKYVLYGNKCGRKNRMKRIKVLKAGARAVTIKKAVRKLKKGTSYKFIMVAVDGDNRVVSTSKVIHIVTKGGKKCNFKSVTTKAKKNRVTLKKGKSFKLGAKGVPASRKLKPSVHVNMRYQAMKPEIAAVTRKGIIKAKASGTCYVYAYAGSGVFKKIKVIVR